MGLKKAPAEARASVRLHYSCNDDSIGSLPLPYMALTSTIWHFSLPVCE